MPCLVLKFICGHLFPGVWRLSTKWPVSLEIICICGYMHTAYCIYYMNSNLYMYTIITYIYTCICVYIYICIYRYTYICIYSHIQIHIFSRNTTVIIPVTRNSASFGQLVQASWSKIGFDRGRVFFSREMAFGWLSWSSLWVLMSSKRSWLVITIATKLG